MPEDAAELLSLEDAARRLGLLQVTLQDAVRRGYLFPERVTAEGTWFRRDAVDRYARTLGLPWQVPAPQDRNRRR